MSGPRTITEELARIHAKLEADSKPHSISLLTVSSVEDAIRTARVSYASSGGAEGRPGGEDYMQAVCCCAASTPMSQAPWARPCKKQPRRYGAALPS